MSFKSSSALLQHAETYSANGNRLGVVLLRSNSSRRVFMQDAELLRWLAGWGQNMSLDSVMVVHQNKNATIVADVFEPWGQTSENLRGSWSTMCGNGMMAVALFYEKHIAKLRVGQVLSISTMSGIRLVTKQGQSRYCVCMGSFTQKRRDLSKYIQLNNQLQDYFDLALPKELAIRFSTRWNIGLTGDRVNGVIDGEPHVVLFGENSSMNAHSLRRIAMVEGPAITKDSQQFPHEINANFAIVKQIDASDGDVHVLACTYERGLGGNPERSITGACGTGATAISATLYRLLGLAEGTIVHVAMPAGKLMVYRELGRFYLLGSVTQD